MNCSKFGSQWILSILILALICTNVSFADENPQVIPPDWDPVIGPPIEKTPWEAANEHLVDYKYPTDDPPPQPVVNPAEWEPMTGVLIRYPLGLPTSLIAEMSEDVEVMTIVSGASQQQQAYNQYQSAGVNMDNCTWLVAPSNSMWTRDYGPWYIFTGNDEQGITDHIYNRPYRPDDNNIPWVLGAAMNIPVYGMPVIHTGGNYMSDGMGIGMSTNLVYDENPGLTQQQVDDYMFEYVGIEDYDVVPDILSGGIHHIDCWAKMLDPGRILVKRLDPPNPTLEANVAYWESKISSYGRPYEVIRVDCYSSTPYTNSLILNDKVFVPLFGGALDDQAMQTYEEAMPGYEILGYYGSWVSDDAIHCRAMGMTDRYMLRIVHVPLLDQENTGLDYEVEATVHAYSNQPLLPGMPEILWKVEGGSYSSASMAYQGDDLYLGYIPAQPDYSTIYYYIHAEDESGRRENHPYIGAGNPHHFFVAPDTIAPEIVHQPLENLSVYEWPPMISAQVTDNSGVDEVYVEYAINGISQPNVTLTPVGNIYSGQLSGTVSIGDSYEYRIVAVDASVGANTAYSPETGMYGGDIVPAYLSDMEDGAPDWTHGVVLPGFNDQWHLTTQQNHTTGGTYSWKCGDTGTGAYGNLLDAGLVSPEYTIEAGSRLTFWQIMSAETSSSYPGYAYDGGLVEVSVNGGDWTQITPISGYPYLVRVGSTPGPFPAETPIFSGLTSGWEEVSFDLSGIAGDVRFRFRFGSDGSTAEEGWYLDDVLLVLGTGGAPPLEITLTPENPPIIIPATGGSFNYNIAGANNGATPETADIWCDATLPNGSNYGPTLGPITGFTFPGNWSTNRDRTQTVPAGAPSGNYSYNGYIGIYPDIIYAQDSFSFEKLSTGDGELVDTWLNTGEPFVEPLASTADVIPESFALLQAYPNPFNPTTTISYALPSASLVKLTVYDLQGRTVAELVNGMRDTGLHEVTWDATGFASGIYFYRIEAGEFRAVRKTLLVK